MFPYTADNCRIIPRFFQKGGLLTETSFDMLTGNQRQCDGDKGRHQGDKGGIAADFLTYNFCNKKPRILEDSNIHGSGTKRSDNE